MIAKLTTGNGFGGALRYDTRQGRDMDQMRILDANGVRYDYDDDGNMIINTKNVGIDFRQQVMGYTGGTIRKPCYHWALAYSPEDRVTEDQMKEDAKEFLYKIGFDDTQYVMTAHYDKAHHHLHIVTNVVNNKGKRIPTVDLIEKAHEAAQVITKRNGYVWGKKVKKEAVTKEKIHHPHERAKYLLRSIVDAAAKTARSLDDFKEILKEQGVTVELKIAKDGKRGGISFSYEYENQVHPFKGSSLGRQYSFANLLKMIEENVKEETDEQKEVISTFSPKYEILKIEGDLQKHRILKCRFRIDGKELESSLLNLNGRILMPEGFEKGVIITPENANKYKYYDLLELATYGKAKVITIPNNVNSTRKTISHNAPLPDFQKQFMPSGQSSRSNVDASKNKGEIDYGEEKKRGISL